MFTHFGLHWSIHKVFWGKTGNGNGGQMLGRTRTRGKGRRRPSEIERSPVRDYGSYVGVYCLHNGHEVINVGKAGLDTQNTLLSRLKGHRRDKLAGQWDSFSWFGREKCEGACDVKEYLLSLEAVLIAVVNPAFNRHDGSFRNAEEVLQVPHEQADGDIQTQLNRIRKAIDNGKHSDEPDEV